MRTLSLVQMALFIAIIAVMGLLPPIPIPVISVPVTLQTLGVMLAGSLLGAKKGFVSVLAFVAIVAIGGPFLAGGRGGFGAVIGPSGGYVLCWPIAAFIIGYLVDRFNPKAKIGRLIIFNIIGGIVIIYAGGIMYYAWMTHTPVKLAALGNLAFLPGDLIKVIITSVLTSKLKHYFNQKAVKNKQAA
ncbi:biotin transport system substrate-specific component [Scopulibacillus daqui]|uniref:Biotin transporter n=1 Tax=Scopulibacillus daqui TaxID=1469162 RepID=A0ABS2PZU7_9BACL|nr:biotin transporter BioY [Scopulibacillus daqui]MBM7645572.1 biotin transport system substrate-specific component [Scopulibacillus daqui]